MHLAATSEQTQLLLDSVNDTEAYCLLENNNGCTALHDAKTVEQTQILLNTINNKRNYCLIRDKFGHTAIWYAKTAEQTQILLLSCSCVSNAVDNIRSPKSYCSIKNNLP